MANLITVAVADDHPLLREGVVRTLQSRDHIHVIGEADNAQSAYELARDTNPDIVLLDISMPGNGIEAARMISALETPPRIIMLTVSEAEDDIMQALKAGASGYALKGLKGEQLVGVVESIYNGETYIPPALAAQVLMAMASSKAKGPEGADPLDSLTARETEILRQVAEGKSNKEVGRALDIQEKTVKHYMTIILQKLHARNRVEAALKAREKWGNLA